MTRYVISVDDNSGGTRYVFDYCPRYLSVNYTPHKRLAAHFLTSESAANFLHDFNLSPTHSQEREDT